MIYSKFAGFVFVAAVLLSASFLSATELCVELSYTIKVNQDIKTSSIKCTISSMNSQNNFNLDYLMMKLADAAIVPTSPTPSSSDSGSGVPVSAPPVSPALGDTVVEAPSSPKEDPSVVPSVTPLDPPEVKPSTSPDTGAPAPINAASSTELPTTEVPIQLGLTPMKKDDPRRAELMALRAADTAEVPIQTGLTPMKKDDSRRAELMSLSAWQNPRGFKGSQNDLWNLYTGTTDRTQVNRDALLAVGKQVDPAFDMTPEQYTNFMSLWGSMDPNTPLGSALSTFKANQAQGTTVNNNNNSGFDYNKVNWPLWLGGGSLALLALLILLDRRRKRRDDDDDE